MQTLRRLGASVTLIVILAVGAFAGETSSPPCAPPDPGETSSPPCAAAQVTSDDPPVQDQVSAPNAGSEYSVSEIASDILQGVLLLF
jgi:hypothetical protein